MSTDLKMKSIAVMFTDMAGSTQFAETFGGRAAFEKRQQHNNLLVPLIESHSGRLVQIIGDALLAVFDRTEDAARCAIAMQRRLYDYNSSADIDVDALEIHVRAGIHFGKAVVFHEQGRLELAGRAVNVAARVEAGGGKQTDSILISEAARNEIVELKEFLFEAMPPIEAKGVGLLQVHRLRWDKTVNSGFDPGNELGQEFPKQASSPVARPPVDNRGGCNCLLADLEQSQGIVGAVFALVRPSDAPRVVPRMNAGEVVKATGARAVESTFAALQKLGFSDAAAERHEVQWWLEDDQAVHCEDASIGLPLCLAVAAAYTGIPIDNDVAATGDVNRGRVIGVSGLPGILASIPAADQIRTLVVSSDNRTDLRHDNNIVRAINADSVESAIADILGPSLGLTASRLTSATVPDAAEELGVQLWLEKAGEQQVKTRDISIRPVNHNCTWHIGDSIRICVKASSPCHMTLVNVGSSGAITVLLPNAMRTEVFLEPDEVVSFPDDQDSFSFQLDGPPGRERLIAIASRSPLGLTPRDFDQRGEIVFAQPTTRDISIVAHNLTSHTLARTEIDFYVTSAHEVPAKASDEE